MSEEGSKKSRTVRQEVSEARSEEGMSEGYTGEHGVRLRESEAGSDTGE